MIMTRPSRARLLMAMAAVLAAACSGSEKRRIETAHASAQQWLAVLDEERYDECWSQASSHLRARSPKEDWTREVAAARAGRGKPIWRHSYERRFLTRLGNGPEGQYVNLLYGANPDGQRSFGEMMTMVLEPDGVWRVYGYKVVGKRAPNSE
jgi:uncharacterized protein DUF4019